MKMTNKKLLTLIFGLAFVIALSLCFGFDWPQVVENPNVFSSFFGQPRGSAYTNSLIFENPAEVFPAEKGTVLITLETGISDMGWFDSTLGNAVVLSHSNDMLTVYGNMDEITLKDDLTDVTQEMKLGMSGTSGWQKGKNCLEFQVVDTKSKNLINPFILMPVLQNKADLQIKNLVATNNSGKTIQISNYLKMSSGVYRLYIKKQPQGMTYKTSVFVNGALVENIIFDVLTQSDNRLAIKGKKLYTFEEIYPDGDNQLLAEVILSKGRNIITVTVEDYFGNTKSANYTVDVI